MKKKRKIKDPVKKIVRKPCMSCGSPCWRNDVYYCWECYKYQYYESK